VRQLTYTAPGEIEWREAPEPRIEGPGEAIVSPLAVATCDLDGPLVRGETPFPAPIAMGHEMVGEVVETGDEVASVAAGDRVVVPFQISCGSCEACRSGHTGNCTTVQQLAMYGLGAAGGDWGGALSDLVRVPYADAMLVPLPVGLDPVTAASAGDNISDGWRTVAPRLREHPGAEVLIVGGAEAGSIGLYAAGAAVALGAARVAYLDHEADRLDRARELGADAIEGDYGERYGLFPVTVDASGDEDGLALALRSTAPDGFCTSTSIFFSASQPLPFLEMYTRCVTLHTGRCHSRALLPDVLAALAGDSLHPDFVTDSVVDWENAPEALRDHRRKTIFSRTA